MTPAEAPITVLVADDHPMYRSSVERAVRTHPRLAVVASVADGRTALDTLRALAPAVAVVDLRMPGLDGLELLDACSREGLTTRIVLLTGHLESDAVYRAVQLGAAAVLSKVTEPQMLTDAIIAVDRGETILSRDAQALVAGAVRARRDDDRPTLSPRESEVLRRVADGETVATMASAMYLSPSTVKSHVESLYRKLGVNDRGAAVAAAMRRGILH